MALRISPYSIEYNNAKIFRCKVMGSSLGLVSRSSDVVQGCAETDFRSKR